MIFKLKTILNYLFNNKNLKKSEKDFFYNITHELKTPITTTSLVLEIFHKNNYQLSIDKTKNYIDILNIENQKMKNLVNKLLNISVIEKKSINQTPNIVDIHELILKQIKEFEIIFQNKNAKILTDLKASRHYIRGDAEYLNIVFSNLIDNAIKYTTNHPIINIKTQSTENNIQIQIQDNGIGIPQELFSKIFDKFYTNQTIKKTNSYGLGLYFVKQILNNHNATIKIESELNKGATFIINFPTTEI